MESIPSVLNLLEKKKKTFADLKQIVLGLRKKNLDMPDATLEYGKILVQEYKNQLQNDCKKEKLQFD